MGGCYVKSLAKHPTFSYLVKKGRHDTNWQLATSQCLWLISPSKSLDMNHEHNVKSQPISSFDIQTGWFYSQISPFFPTCFAVWFLVMGDWDCPRSSSVKPAFLGEPHDVSSAWYCIAVWRSKKWWAERLNHVEPEEQLGIWQYVVQWWDVVRFEHVSTKLLAETFNK